MAVDLHATFARFAIGLRARHDDIEALREAFPELWSGEFDARGHRPRPRRTRLIPPLLLLHHPEEWLAELLDWVSKAGEDFAVHRSSEEHSCPLHREDCPLHRADADLGDAPGQEAGKVEDDEGLEEAEPEEWLARLLTVGGGPAGSAGKRFLDLLRKATKGCKGPYIRQVIITDPYLHTSVSEDGEDGGGFGWLRKTLDEALLLQKNQEFELFLNPAIGKHFDALGQHISQVYPKATIKVFSVQKGRIHDRFYMVRCKKEDRLHGVFGPSLNGLSGAGVFLLGDLDENALRGLDKVIRCI